MPSVTSLPVPTYGVTFSTSDLELSVDSLIKGLQVSSLVVAQSRISLVFRLDDDVNPTAATEGKEKVVSIDYRGIIVHGISAAAAATAAAPVEGGDNDSTAAAAASSKKKSFYLMLRGNWRREFDGLKGLSSLSIADGDEEEESEIEEEEEGEAEEAFLTEEDEDLSVTEIHLTPSDVSQLEVINESVAACLESHREVEEDEADDVEEEEEDDVEEEEEEAEAIVKDAEVAAPESSSSSSSSSAPFWGSHSIPSLSPVIPGEKVAVIPTHATDRHPGHPEDARLARMALNEVTNAVGAAVDMDAVDGRLGEAKTELPMEEEMTRFGLLTQRRLNTLLAANYFRGDEVAAC